MSMTDNLVHDLLINLGMYSYTSYADHNPIFHYKNTQVAVNPGHQTKQIPSICLQ